MSYGACSNDFLGLADIYAMNIFDIKRNNSNRIYSYIREKKTVTKQNITNGLNLSLPTVTQNLENLSEKGLINSGEKIANQRGGRNPVSYSCVPNAKIAVGVSITRHHIKTVVCNLNGEVIERNIRPQLFNKSDEYLRILGDEVDKIISKSNIPKAKILGVGIAVPGLVDYENNVVCYSMVIDAFNMTADDFSKYIPYEARLFHDTDASGFSEVWVSPALCNAFYFSLCTSIGGSIFLKDSMFNGDGKYCGEVGHMVVEPNGKECYCGRRGCLDAYCNSDVLSINTDSDLDAFFDGLRAKDAKLVKIWDEYTDYLALAVHQIRMITGCKIILGGYVGGHIGNHIERICNKVDRYNPFSEKSIEYVVPCKNNFEAIVAEGAGLYIIKDFLDAVQ